MSKKVLEETVKQRESLKKTVEQSQFVKAVGRNNRPDRSCQYNKEGMVWVKVAGIAAVAYLVMVSATYAGLDDQLKKSEEIIYGWISKLIMGGSTIAGGAMAISKGNSLQGLAVAGAGIIVGATLSLIRDGSILTAFGGK